MDIELECAVCGQAMSASGVPIPSTELLIETWRKNHTHTPDEVQAWYAVEIAMAAAEGDDDDQD